MGQTLQRCLGTVIHLQAAQYTTESASDWPVICCPRCGDISELSEAHEVLPGGAVRPIWRCLLCVYAEFIELESWDV